MKYYIKMSPEQVKEERECRERSCRRIKLITIKIPFSLALLFIIWMFKEGGSSTGVPAILVTSVIGVPWCLFWNWIANMEKR